MAVAPMAVYDAVRPLGEIEDHVRKGVSAYLGVGRACKSLRTCLDRKTAMRVVSQAAKVEART
jgi:hypothetical protein